MSTCISPRVSLITAFEADKDGNLYTGFNTEDTPVITEATHFRQVLDQRRSTRLSIKCRAWISPATG
ncbi:malonate decarboxylase subunit alpha [Klebsiella pneumoniae subsp. pneumoniae]|nr:malonate decarboxylase subunit alpha [Klebsiella pneumoniae subsp. pneumoniae]